MLANEQVNPFDLITELKQSTGGNVFFCKNAGNAGDAIIAAATYQLFNKNNISVIDFKDDMIVTPNDIFIYGGGGNFISYYSTAKKIIEHYHDKVFALILLPHTINGHAKLLSELGANVYLFCRERISYEYTRQRVENAKVYFYEDLGLFLDKDNLRLDLYPALKTFRMYRRNYFAFRRDLLRAKGNRILYCFREDVEASSKNISNKNIDLSSYFVFDKKASVTTVNMITRVIFNAIKKFDIIHTNRLHVCIAGYLLDKEVYFYKNSYYKNESMYNSCFINKGNKIHWINN